MQANLDFSNTVDDLIKVEEMEDSSDSSEQGSCEEDSKDIRSAPGEIKTVEDYLDERATTVGEGQYEHTSQSTPSLICSSPLSFSCIFHLSMPYIFPCL